MNKERFTAYTDAIFAIILTIMILNFRVPTRATWSALATLAQPFLAYIITFVIMWVSWYSHHELMKGVTTITYAMYWMTGLWIVQMSLLPFATAWVGQNFMSFVPNMIYALLGFASFANYHLLMEPEALKHTPAEKRPMIRDSVPLEVLRIGAIIMNVIVIWFWPPISLVVMLIFSSLHVSEHVHIWHIGGKTN